MDTKVRFPGELFMFRVKILSTSVSQNVDNWDLLVLLVYIKNP